MQGHFPVPVGCPYRNSGPPKLAGDGGEDRNCFWTKELRNQGFLHGGKNRAKGGLEGRPHPTRRVLGVASPIAVRAGRLVGGWPPFDYPSCFWSLPSR